MTARRTVKRSRLTNKECSVARAMEVVGDRWSILLLREAYYGTKRFDEFQYYLGVAPNILSGRLKKFVDLMGVLLCGTERSAKNGPPRLKSCRWRKCHDSKLCGQPLVPLAIATNPEVFDLE